MLAGPGTRRGVAWRGGALCKHRPQCSCPFSDIGFHSVRVVLLTLLSGMLWRGALVRHATPRHATSSSRSAAQRVHVCVSVSSVLRATHRLESVPGRRTWAADLGDQQSSRGVF